MRPQMCVSLKSAENTVVDKEHINEQIKRLQTKYTLAVKAYSAVKNVIEREQAKALIAKLGMQIDELKNKLNSP